MYFFIYIILIYLYIRIIFILFFFILYLILSYQTNLTKGEEGEAQFMGASNLYSNSQQINYINPKLGFKNILSGHFSTCGWLVVDQYLSSPVVIGHMEHQLSWHGLGLPYKYNMGPIIKFMDLYMDWGLFCFYMNHHQLFNNFFSSLATYNSWSLKFKYPKTFSPSLY